MAREDAARLEFPPPLLDRPAALLPGVGVAVDVDEVEGLVGEVEEGLFEAHPQEQRAPLACRRETLDGFDVFRRIVVVGPSVDAPKPTDAVVAEDQFGEAAPGHAEFDAFAVEEGGGEGFAVGVDGGGSGHGGGPEAEQQERDEAELSHQCRDIEM